MNQLSLLLNLCQFYNLQVDIVGLLETFVLTNSVLFHILHAHAVQVDLTLFLFAAYHLNDIDVGKSLLRFPPRLPLYEGVVVAASEKCLEHLGLFAGEKAGAFSLVELVCQVKLRQEILQALIREQAAWH